MRSAMRRLIDRRPPSPRTCLVALLLAIGAVPAAAQGWIEPLRPGGDRAVVKLGTDVSVRITGRVAEVEVEEWFENRGGGLGEGDYLYPLPGESVFSNFSLYQGDQELRGETMDAERARTIYEEIVRRKRDPALIEMVGHGLVRARVFPIEPGQTRKITLRYTQLLERSGDAVQFRYAAGARSPGTQRPVPLPHPLSGRPDRPSTGSARARRLPTGAPLRFTLDADAREYRDPFSPTHELEVEVRDGRLRVRPVRDLTGDFSVFLPVAGNAVGISVATHRVPGEDGYFMLTLSPGSVDGTGTPRDVTAVVDVSGSMSGEKIEQTRAALRQLVASLRPDDRFRLIAFSNRIRASGHEWAPATREERDRARDWIDGLRAEGGTNIAGALEEALRLESPEDRLPVVLFLTDGLPTVGEQDPDRIADRAERARSGVRVFAFGVGYDVNTRLLDRLSAAGRGSTSYVEPGENVERAVSILAAKITNPVLTDLEIAGAPVRLTELYPETPPDLFAGEELVVFGRYAAEGEGELRVAGRRAGRPESLGVRVDFPGRAEGNDYLPRLWASRKLGELTRQARLHGADPELVEAIRATALRYGLLSEYTSYLVQEPEAFAGDLALQPRAAAGGVPAPQPPAVGRAAVQAAERDRARRELTSAAALEAAEEEAARVAFEVMAHGDATAARMVGGRSFRLEDGVWTELGRDEAPDEVRIRLYGGAYFELLRALPELEPVLRELEPVLVRGRDVTLRFGQDGAETLPAREVARLVDRFRSR